MKTFVVKGRLVTTWLPIEPESVTEWQNIEVTVEAEDAERAKEKAADKVVEDNPAKDEAFWEFVDAFTGGLTVQEISAAELAEMRLKAEQKKLRDDVERHAVGTLFDMAPVAA